MSDTDLYYVETTAADFIDLLFSDNRCHPLRNKEIIETCLKPMAMSLTKPNRDSANQLERDLDRIPFLGTEAQYTQWLQIVRNTKNPCYNQGDMQTNILGHLIEEKYFRTRDGAIDGDSHPYQRITFSYLDKDNRVCGICFGYMKTDPSQWYVFVAQDSNKPPQQRNIAFATSLQLSNLHKKPLKEYLSRGKGKKKHPKRLEKAIWLRQIEIILKHKANQKAVEKIIENAFTRDGKISPSLITICSIARSGQGSSEKVNNIANNATLSLLSNRNLRKVVKADIKLTNEEVVALMTPDNSLAADLVAANAPKTVKAIIFCHRLKQVQLIPKFRKPLPQPHMRDVIIHFYYAGLNNKDHDYHGFINEYLFCYSNYFKLLVNNNLITHQEFARVLTDKHFRKFLPVYIAFKKAGVKYQNNSEFKEADFEKENKTFAAAKQLISSFEDLTQSKSNKNASKKQRERNEIKNPLKNQLKNRIHTQIVTYFSSEQDNKAKLHLVTEVKKQLQNWDRHMQHHGFNSKLSEKTKTLFIRSLDAEKLFSSDALNYCMNTEVILSNEEISTLTNNKNLASQLIEKYNHETTTKAIIHCMRNAKEKMALLEQQPFTTLRTLELNNLNLWQQAIEDDTVRENAVALGVLHEMGITHLDDYVKSKEARKFNQLLEKIEQQCHSTRKRIQTHSQEKYQSFCENEKAYKSELVLSLKTYLDSTKSKADKMQLKESLQKSENKFIDSCLHQDTKKAARRLGCVVANLISHCPLFFGLGLIANAVYYKKTGSWRFFSETKSTQEIKQLDKNIINVACQA